jgi:hypothetical protein
MATYPESIRARLLAWQEDRREFFMDTILEIVAEFIAFENRRPEPAADAVEAVARAMAKSDGLDWDEVCGLESDDLGDCNSGTCIAAHHEDHDSEWARGFYRRHARAALAAIPGPQWLDIASAKKDHTIIWAILRDDIYPTLMPGREDLKRWNGLQLPLRHEGLADDGFDIGWMLAAPVGHGGFPDDWIAGWVPLLPASAKAA